MKFLENAPKFLFFTGKGGVGKTSVACATAVRLADAGKRVLVVSTDPASNLDEVLGVPLGTRPTAIPEVPGLLAVNLDPEAAAAEYRERMVAPYRGVLPDDAVRSMEEQFSGSCTLEIAAFDEFARLVGDERATSEFDHVVFDTAPTGHTLRLLTLPSAWSGFMETNTSGTSCLGPLAGLHEQQALYRRTLELLSDPSATVMVLVTRPEGTALQEAERTSGELTALGVTNQHLVVNAVFRTNHIADPIAVAMQRRVEAALASIPDKLANLPRTEVPLAPASVLGIGGLRALGEKPDGLVSTEVARLSPLPPDLHGLTSFIDEIAADGRGVVMAMGKGGVGKTTIAAAIAHALAERGLQVHLSTTDPAAHVAATIAGNQRENLTVGRINPQQETQRYSEEVMATAGAALDAQGKALLEEDLRSPCTEEIAVFRAFAEAVAGGQDRIVVLDTAPTGHTILLLDAALSYHREVLRQSTQMPESVVRLLPRLRDPHFTRVLIVTLPEATPFHEAAALQQDLQRAEIFPFGWVVNQSLVPLEVVDPVLWQKQQGELRFIDEARTASEGRFAVVAWQTQPPMGPAALSAVVAGETALV